LACKTAQALDGKMIQELYERLSLHDFGEANSPGKFVHPDIPASQREDLSGSQMYHSGRRIYPLEILNNMVLSETASWSKENDPVAIFSLQMLGSESYILILFDPKLSPLFPIYYTLTAVPLLTSTFSSVWI
jgi:hypothetical protein